MKSRKHYVMTRFNIGLYRTNAKHPSLSEEWMEKRIKIFTERCVPSLKEQTIKNFTWVILVDARTERKHIAKIASAIDGIDNKIIVCKWGDRKFKERECVNQSWLEQFIEMARKKSRIAVMTRLDNDDALSRRYIETAQEEILKIGNGEYVVDFPRGIMLDVRTQECWLAEHKIGTPFLTLVEKVHDRMGTVYQCSHYDLAKRYEAFMSKNKRIMWQMNIHDSNKTNRIFDHMKVERLEYSDIEGF